MAVYLPLKPPFIAPPLVHTFIDLPCINVPMTVTPFQVPLPFYSLSSHLHFCVPVSKYKYHCGGDTLLRSIHISKHKTMFQSLTHSCLKIHSKNSIFCDTKISKYVALSIHDKICEISTFLFPQKAVKYATNIAGFSTLRRYP